MTLATLAARKHLPLDFLVGLGLHDLDGGRIGIPYRDAAGRVLWERIRHPEGSEKRFHQPDGIALVPYGRERLAQARHGAPLYLCEGESDTWVLWHLGLPALGLPGSGTVGCLSEADLALVDEVRVLPDNDAAGNQFWDGVSRRLRSMAWPGQLRRWKVPGPHKDVGDWYVAAGADAVRAALTATVATVSRDSRNPESDKKHWNPFLVCLADVLPEPVRWLWPSWMPSGSLVVLDGDPGLGKSTLTLDLAARISTGRALPPLEGLDLGYSPAGILLLGAEDSLKHTVRPRLDAAGADNTLIYSLEGMRCAEEPDRAVQLPYDLEEMVETIRTHRVKLAVVDPLMAFLGGEFDAHKDQDVRRCLRPLSKLAEDLDIVILLLRHLNKLSGGPALYRGGSSIGISGAARASLIVGRDPDPAQDRHVLAMNKCNLTKRPESLAYTIEAAGMGSRIVWQGPVDLGPNDILGHGGAPAKRSDRQTTQTWLSALLADGPVSVEEIEEEAHNAGHGWRTVEKAKKDLGVRSKRDSEAWSWELPGQRPQDRTLCEDDSAALPDKLPFPD